jgi:RHS repeat-associated protein
VTKTYTWAYVYDNLSIVLELYSDGTGTTKTWYTQGPGIDEHLALERNGSHYYYHADALGSIVAITDSSRNVVQSYTYDSFGLPKPTTSFVNSYTFTGREWDPQIGLHYYRARYYDPMEGRFISKDPFGFRDGINLYAYVKNNPANKKDPSGLGDYPGTWDNGVVTNNTDHDITVIDMDNGIVDTLHPGETSDANIDMDFVVDNGRVTKVGPNTVSVNSDGSVTQTGVDLIPGHNPGTADAATAAAVTNAVSNNGNGRNGASGGGSGSGSSGSGRNNLMMPCH